MDISSPYREGLPTTTKADRRWRSKPLPTSSKPSILLAFFSCVAWLYIAGRFVFLCQSSCNFFLLIHVFFWWLFVLFWLLGCGKMQRTEICWRIYSRRTRSRFVLWLSSCLAAREKCENLRCIYEYVFALVNWITLWYRHRKLGKWGWHSPSRSVWLEIKLCWKMKTSKRNESEKKMYFLLYVWLRGKVLYESCKKVKKKM